MSPKPRFNQRGNDVLAIFTYSLSRSGDEFDPRDDPIVEEITVVLREWHPIWKQGFVVGFPSTYALSSHYLPSPFSTCRSIPVDLFSPIAFKYAVSGSPRDDDGDAEDAARNSVLWKGHGGTYAGVEATDHPPDRPRQRQVVFGFGGP